AATAAAAADVVASLSKRRGGAAAVFVLAIDGTDTDDVDGDGVAARVSAAAAIPASAIVGGGGVSGWTTGAGARGRTGPVGDFRTLGRISAIAFLGMPSFGSGPINARSKRPGSTSFGSFLGSGRRKTSIRGCTGSIGRGVAGGLTGGGRRERTGGGAKV